MYKICDIEQKSTFLHPVDPFPRWQRVFTSDSGYIHGDEAHWSQALIIYTSRNPRVLASQISNADTATCRNARISGVLFRSVMHAQPISSTSFNSNFQLESTKRNELQKYLILKIHRRIARERKREFILTSTLSRTD